MPRSLTSEFNRAARAEPRNVDLYLMRDLIKGNNASAFEMIDEGADVNYRNKLGETPLMAAALNGNAAMIERLLKAGADVNAIDAQGNSPLHWLSRAEWKRDIPVIAQMLLENGADNTARNNMGETAGEMAHNLNKDRLARILGAPLPREEAIEVIKPIRLKTAPKPEPEPEPVPEPVVAEAPAPPPPAKAEEKGDTISEMQKRYGKAGLFG